MHARVFDELSRFTNALFGADHHGFKKPVAQSF